jgi:hypothetical protein
MSGRAVAGMRHVSRLMMRRAVHGRVHRHGHIHRHGRRRPRVRCVPVADDELYAVARAEHGHESDRNQRAQQQAGQHDRYQPTHTLIADSAQEAFPVAQCQTLSPQGTNILSLAAAQVNRGKLTLPSRTQRNGSQSTTALSRGLRRHAQTNIRSPPVSSHHRLELSLQPRSLPTSGSAASASRSY